MNDVFFNSIIDEFEYCGRTCYVRKVDYLIGSFHCGYVDVSNTAYALQDNDFWEWHPVTEKLKIEITFNEKVGDRYLIGFDTGHCYDSEYDKQASSVKFKTMLLAKELFDCDG